MNNLLKRLWSNDIVIESNFNVCTENFLTAAQRKTISDIATLYMKKLLKTNRHESERRKYG